MSRECLEEIIRLLPKEITDDDYFRRLKDIVFGDLDNSIKLFSSVGIIREVFNLLSNFQECDLYPLVGENLLYMLYSVDGVITEFGIRKNGDIYLVQLEKIVNSNVSKTILIKSRDVAIVEIMSFFKKLGYVTDFDLDIICYKGNYDVPFKMNVEEIKNELFCKEFYLPSKMFFLRKDFQDNSKAISVFSTEGKMLESDENLRESEKFLFSSPFVIDNLKDFMITQFQSERLFAYKKFLYNGGSKELVCLDRLDVVLHHLLNMLGSGSEIVMSDNLYQNLALVASGNVANALNTKGYIIKKTSDGYVMYGVNLTISEIIFMPHLLSQAEVYDIFKKNPLNEEVEDLSDFLEINRFR